MSAIKLLEEARAHVELTWLHAPTDDVSDLLARIDALLLTGGWIAVSERLPEIDLPVWCWDGVSIWWGCRVDDSDGWLWARSYGQPEYYAAAWTCFDAETDDDYQPTHWMPLPLPPLPEAT